MEPQSIFDLSAQEFEGAIAELGLPQSEADQLRREYRRQHSPFSGLYGLLDRVRGQDAEQGRVRADVLPMTRPEGMTGMEALLAGEAQLALPGGLLGAAEGAAMGIDAPGSAYQGMIPLEDMAGEALGTAGMAMLGGMAPNVGRLADFDPTTVSMAAARDGFVPDAQYTLSDFGYTQDNPGGSWLQRHQERAEQEIIDNAEGRFGRGITGSITGTLGMQQDMFLPTNRLFELPGLSGEMRRPGDPRFDALLERVREEGFDPNQAGNRVVVAVNHRGEPFLMEGNTRVAVANELGVPSVRTEVRYWNGGEGAEGPFSPGQTVEIASPTPLGSPESRAQQIARMLREGRGDEITEDMLAALDANDNMELADLYASGATGMDMPMDYESRMARAAEMGFGGDRYHGGNMDFQGFAGNVFTSDNPTVASTYNRGMLDAVIYPLRTRPGPLGDVTVEGGLSNWNRLDASMIDDPSIARELDRGMPISTRDIEREAILQGRSGVTFRDINDLGPGFNSQQFRNLGYTPDEEEALRLQYLEELSTPSEIDVRMSPNLVRSRFARFDPRLRNSANLLAANASPELGLLAASAPSEQEQLDQLRTYLGLLAQ